MAFGPHRSASANPFFIIDLKNVILYHVQFWGVSAKYYSSYKWHSLPF